MRGNAQRFQRHEPTKLDKLNALLMFLSGARDEVLPLVTVDQLVARHGCDAKTTEYHLTIARQNAERRAREKRVGG